MGREASKKTCCCAGTSQAGFEMMRSLAAAPAFSRPGLLLSPAALEADTMFFCLDTVEMQLKIEPVNHCTAKSPANSIC